MYRLLISNRVGWTPNANIIPHRKERPAGDEGEVYLLTGIVYQADSTTLLCEFQRIDYHRLVDSSSPTSWNRRATPWNRVAATEGTMERMVVTILSAVGRLRRTSTHLRDTLSHP